MINRLLSAVLFCLLAVHGAAALVPSLPSDFKARTVASPAGADIYVAYGGKGPAVVLLHGYADTGDMWGPMAADLMKDHTVIVPDLRGIGHSSHPDGGYDKKTQAQDIRAVVTALGADKAEVVAHDIGNMVAYAYAATFPDKVTKLVLIDAPIPGIPPWDDIVRDPRLWHFDFNGPEAEKLVEGRERIYLDHIWNTFALHRDRIDEGTRNHYTAFYALPGAMRAGFAQFAAFRQDARDNQEFMKTKLTMPVLAVGGEGSFGPVMAAVMRNAATNVTEAVVPDSGHWVMDENPDFTVKMVRDFLK
jgi:pimeloyl-ACP methyl ester carboxylesterase